MNHMKNYITKIVLLSFALLNGCGNEAGLECAAGSHIDAANGEVSCLSEAYAIADRLPGDCTIDGEVSIADGQCIAQCIEGTAPESMDCELRADCDCDSEITASDAQCALRRSLGLAVFDECNAAPEPFYFSLRLSGPTGAIIDRLEVLVDYGQVLELDDTGMDCFPTRSFGALLTDVNVDTALDQVLFTATPPGLPYISWFDLSEPIALFSCVGLSGWAPLPSDFEFEIRTVVGGSDPNDLEFSIDVYKP